MPPAEPIRMVGMPAACISAASVHAFSPRGSSGRPITSIVGRVQRRQQRLVPLGYERVALELHVDLAAENPLRSSTARRRSPRSRRRGRSGARRAACRSRSRAPRGRVGGVVGPALDRAGVEHGRAVHGVRGRREHVAVDSVASAAPPPPCARSRRRPSRAPNRAPPLRARSRRSIRTLDARRSPSGSSSGSITIACVHRRGASSGRSVPIETPSSSATHATSTSPFSRTPDSTIARSTSSLRAHSRSCRPPRPVRPSDRLHRAGSARGPPSSRSRPCRRAR